MIEGFQNADFGAVLPDGKVGLFSYKSLDETLKGNVTGLLVEGTSGNTSVFMGFLTYISSNDGTTTEMKLINCRETMREFDNLTEDPAYQTHIDPSTKFIPCNNSKCQSVSCIDCASENSMCMSYECPLRCCTDDLPPISEDMREILEDLSPTKEKKMKRQRISKSSDSDPSSPFGSVIKRGRGRPRKESKTTHPKPTPKATDPQKSKKKRGKRGRYSKISGISDKTCSQCRTKESCCWRFHEITGLVCNKCGCERMGLGTVANAQQKRKDWADEVKIYEGSSKDLPTTTTTLKYPPSEPLESSQLRRREDPQPESTFCDPFGEIPSYESLEQKEEEETNIGMTMEAIPYCFVEDQSIFRELVPPLEYSERSAPISSLDLSEYSNPTNNLFGSEENPGTPTSVELEQWFLDLEFFTDGGVPGFYQE